jgi:hypothetical protein
VRDVYKKKIVEMNDIGKRDIETYLRNLISESLGSQNEDFHESSNALFTLSETAQRGRLLRAKDLDLSPNFLLIVPTTKTGK